MEKRRMRSTYDIIEQTFRQERGRVLATLLSLLHDIELAEDALQDALVTALERWSTTGVPYNPGAWLTTVARNKALDRLRRSQTFQRNQVRLLAELEATAETENDDMLHPDDIPDERLKLIFTCCHPALAKEAQVALTLQTLGGLTTPEIARAFLIPLPTMAQRLVRAKRKIRDAGIPYQVPPAHTIEERLDAVLAVLYLIFSAGYSAPSGDDLVRHDLCEEAMRLTRVLVLLLTQERGLGAAAEANGLLALMLLHHARRIARQTADGAIVLLEDQDRTQWDQENIAEGTNILKATLCLHQPGAYQIQAAIAALHAEATHADKTDWQQIAALYGVLYRDFAPTPVVALNRAVAVAMAEGYTAGLKLIDQLEDSGELADYYLFHAAKADLLRRTGWLDEALTAYQRAWALCENTAEKAFLQQRLTEVEHRMQA
jgi:RNA polymerase sigma-70 factor (ECF subfamily)